MEQTTNHQFYKPNGGDSITDDRLWKTNWDNLDGKLASVDNQLEGKTDKTYVDDAVDFNENNVNGKSINVKYPPTPLIGAKGDGVTDDTTAIQNIIDYANNDSRRVFVPKGKYLISSPIVLNGCTLEGTKANIFNVESEGSCFVAQSKDFIAIKQGSVGSKDIQFGLSDIYVKNALTGFELNYVINSKFERLYAKDCDTGYKLGDTTSVGSMFCEFNNLYSSGTRIGAIVQSKDYFNNNRFNNGYIYGTEKAFHLEVSGGYGAVNNVFNNVELRSPSGRGIILKSALNTTFNSVYFENGGNAIRALNFCTVNLNESVFGLYKANNTNLDTSFVFAEGGFRLKLDGGVVFLTSENDNKYFYDATNSDTHLNVYVTNNIFLNGTATGFARFKQAVNKVVYELSV